jgi:hypothetical protein
MEALILFLIGLVTGHAVAASRHEVRLIDVEVHAVELASNCEPSPDSAWVATLDDPEAQRWVVLEDGGLRDPATGERIVIECLAYEMP